jgi:hypothetical protein
MQLSSFIFPEGKLISIRVFFRFWAFFIFFNFIRTRRALWQVTVILAGDRVEVEIWTSVVAHNRLLLLIFCGPLMQVVITP